MRESVWKNVAVATFFSYALSIAYTEDWFMNRNEYFNDYPWPSPDNLRWYYAIYASFWIQSIDFLLSITGNHYVIKRKDNREMLIHHLSTVALMFFSYAFDLTRVGLCVLMIHDINDLLLETAKICVYLEWKTASDVLFGIFALVWYIVRWGFFTHNIILGVYYNCYDTLIVSIYEQNGLFGLPPQVWYAAWTFGLSLLVLLLILHVYWGYLIGRMIVKALTAGTVEKDIRSDSESDDDTKKPAEKEKTKDPVRRRRRAPKAE